MAQETEKEKLDKAVDAAAANIARLKAAAAAAAKAAADKAAENGQTDASAAQETGG